MKNKIENKGVKKFDTVKFFREVKENISKDIYGINLEPIKEYFKNKKMKADVK